MGVAQEKETAERSEDVVNDCVFSLFSLVLSFDFFDRKKETKESTNNNKKGFSIKYTILLKPLVFIEHEFQDFLSI